MRAGPRPCSFPVSSVANEAVDAIVQQARAAKIPTVSQTGGSAEKGVILSLAPSAAEQGEAAAKIAARLLREKPAGIPVEIPKMVELVLNLKEKQALSGIKAPFDPITEATKVIK